jgi:AraC family transcriptional regulator, regulatory protein of adaptative response / methylphosphotriester-DNA alkyltransferase methyltransferase
MQEVIEKKIPAKILTRKDQITTDFLKLADKHVADLMEGRVLKRFHARNFGELLFIHPRHLTNTIQLTLNTSPCEIMEEKILAEAKTLLADKTLSIAEIGMRFAYTEATNFTKFFKSMTGITPLQYRKQIA